MNELGYKERLTLPWYWWPPAFIVVTAVALQVGWGIPMLAAWIPAAVLLPATAALLWWSGRLRVAVQDGALIVDDAQLPAQHVGEAIPLDAAARRELLGASADPVAFVVQRPWIPTAVQVLVDDPNDATPYWLISTRRPAQLAHALNGEDRLAPAPSDSRVG